MQGKELKVVYVDDLKTNIKVKAMMLKPEEIIKKKYNRAKKKEEDRKMAKDYIER